MRERRRNLMVGVTVLAALTILGGMIIIFRELPAFMRIGYEVQFRSHDTGGVGVGSDVLLAGIRIGRVSEIKFTKDNPRKGVTLAATIDRDINIPGDVNAYIRSRGFTGAAVIELISDGLPPGSQRKDLVTGGPLAWLPKDDDVTITITRRADAGGLIPADLVADIREAMASFKSLADTMNSFFAPPPGPTTASAPAATSQPRPANFQTTMAKLDAALDAVNATLGDKENQANIKAALANLKAAAAAAVEAMNNLKSMASEASGATKSASKRFDELISHLIDDADRMGKILTSVHHIAVKIEKGEGTVGRLINDPALHENLTDAVKQLKATLNTLDELLAKWKKEGLKIQWTK